jgi:hypothetical protein
VASNSAGIRITQAGVSAPFAADYQYVFNSDWPSLAIAFDTTITVLANAVSNPIPHGLGFYPLTMAWFSVGGVSMGRFYGITIFDKTNVYIDNSQNSSDVVVNIKCYNTDISQPANYFLPQAPTLKTAYDPSTGIKVSKHGKSITSNDLRDFILHSRAQSPALLVIKPVSNGSVSYTNPVGYTPWVLGFISPFNNNTQYQCVPPGGNAATPAFFQIGSQSVVETDVNGLGCLVVLRDPLVVPNNVRVVY